MTSVELGLQHVADLTDNLRAFARGHFLPAIPRGDDRHLRARILADNTVLDGLNRGATPILVEQVSLLADHLILDDDIQVNLLALVALDLDRIIALDLTLTGLLDHTVGLDGDR